MKRFISVLFVLMTVAVNSRAEDAAIATVGGKPIPFEEFQTYISTLAAKHGVTVDHITDQSRVDILNYYVDLEIVFQAGLKMGIHETEELKDLISASFIEKNILDLAAKPGPRVIAAENKKLENILWPMREQYPNDEDKKLIFKAAMNAGSHRDQLLRGRVIFLTLKKKKMDFAKALKVLRPVTKVRLSTGLLSDLRHKPASKRTVPPDGGIGFFARDQKTGKLQYASRKLFDGFQEWWHLQSVPEAFEANSKIAKARKKERRVAPVADKAQTEQAENTLKNLLAEKTPTPLREEVDVAGEMQHKMDRLLNKQKKSARGAIIFGILVAVMLVGYTIYTKRG